MASPEKRARQNLRARRRNITAKTAVKLAIKKVRVALQAGDRDKAKQALAEAIPVIDKAVSHGVLHKNNASRKISRLSSQVFG